MISQIVKLEVFKFKFFNHFRSLILKWNINW
jgi:hypothetical protein